MAPRVLQDKYGFENPFRTDPLTKKASRYCSGKRLLDVGCGEGADSTFFAKKGFHVTSFDKNPTYLKRFRAYRRDNHLESIRILERSALAYSYPTKKFDVVICLLVLCCMKKTEFEKMLPVLKGSVKPGGVIIMSARNYLDPEFQQYRRTSKEIEPNTFQHKDKCCNYLYFIEKNRLREMFDDFEILYYNEGFAPCKYDEHPIHGDSSIICRRRL